MSDQTIPSTSAAALFSGTALALCFATPSYAGDEILYAGVPDWVDEAVLERGEKGEGPAHLIYDQQHWLNDGVVTSYSDTASRIDNPQMLTENGTISLNWLPDKGDITIHRVEIVRDGNNIDVLEDAKFDVIRREQGLEQRLLDGELTATLAIPGLQVGDVLRVTHSITVDDQALGDEMQVLQFLGSEPWKVDFARTIVSWPAEEDIYWRAEERAGVAPPVSRNGINRIEVELPLAEAPDMPNDAPMRYRRPAVLRVGTYADWQKLSRTMEPHFTKAAVLQKDGDIVREARAIMAKTDDPLHRAALATQLVQDEVSYLMNGLDGGNYLPQTASETWEKRYGDCKAKSVLLHALLTEMGIASQTVLVHTRIGDAVPELLPVPGNFDHMIVRAMIDGQDYWLDGTSAATRLNNIDWIPPFHYALPLTAQGSDLVALGQRDQHTPNMVLDVVTDYSAGVDLPALYSLTAKLYGPQGAAFRQIADQNDEDALRNLGKRMLGREGGGVVSSVVVSYDDLDAVATLHITGVTPTDFEWQDGRLAVDGEIMPNPGFDASRAKPEWRDIPVATSGPMLMRVTGRMLLPGEGDGFSREGPHRIDTRFANRQLTITNSLDGPNYTGSVDVAQFLGEVAPDQLPDAKRSARKFSSQKTKLYAPDDVQWRWEIPEAQLVDRSEPIIAAYDAAIEFADDDDFGPLEQRASFLHDTYRFDDALSDLDTLVEKNTSAWVLGWRANVLYSLGRTEASLADLERAYELDPTNEIGMVLAERMAYAGQGQAAIDLMYELPVPNEERAYFAGILSIVTGLAGDVDGGLEIMADAVADQPQNETALNSDCWYRGLFDVAIEDALDVCTQAIERASNGANALDSRALVHYRMGDNDAALADLDSALELTPGLAASHYLRGAILLEQGEERGRDDIAIALRIAPEIVNWYKQHGIAPAMP